jgi:peptide/nickel transport system substrate-binding protein
VPSSHWAYDEAIGAEATAFDPQAARALLNEAGWTDRDGDGVRENAGGVRLSFTIKYPSNRSWQSVAVIMQEQLANIGIEAIPTGMELGTLVRQVVNSRPRDFDGWIVSWVTDVRLDDTALFHSSSTDGPNGWSGTQRPDIDRYLDRLPLISDREEARPMWQAYQELLVDEQPSTFLYWSDRLIGVNKRIEGEVMDVRGEWGNVKDWWISPDRRGR